jgi:hypothetical protein
MGVHNIPLEVSISAKADGSHFFRVLADLQDHRHRLAGNWNRYVTAGARITGSTPERIARLMAQHLDIDPPNTKTPVYHGVRYGKGGQQSSLYFSTVTWPKSLLHQRVSRSSLIQELEQDGSNAPWVHLAGYDFDASGTICRTKLYAWLDRDEPLDRLRDRLPGVPGLQAAQALLEHLLRVHQMEPPHESLLVQFSRKPSEGRWSRKLYLHAPKWRFDNGAGIGNLARYMAEAWGKDPSKLLEVLEIFSSHGVKLLPSGLAVDLSHKIPQSFTFYFLPLVQPAAAEIVTRAKLRNAYRRAISALKRQAKRGWAGIPERERAGLLSRIRLIDAALAEPLVRGNAPDAGEAAQICAARETLTLVRLGKSVKPQEWRVAATATPELNALRLLIGVESKRISRSEARRAVGILHRQERWGGGWEGYSDELEVTVLVLHALVRCLETYPSLEEFLQPVLRRSAYWLRGTPVPREPARVALWIRANTLLGDTRSEVSMERGLAFLVETQGRDGTWMPSPFESSSGERAWMDAGGWLATAVVAETLALFA